MRPLVSKNETPERIARLCISASLADFSVRVAPRFSEHTVPSEGFAIGCIVRACDYEWDIAFSRACHGMAFGIVGSVRSEMVSASAEEQ
ncbi:MAG: hypothetical protein FWD57_06545 [Polyangiaceae bacterium]|nr:hypothetical protein [Polyangiaceae bacterium]